MIEQWILPKSRHNRPGHPMQPIGVMFHATSNWSDGANAEMHARYLLTTANSVSWHVTVDANKAVQHLPFDESCWAAGDGDDGHYNRNFIHVEICCNRVKRGQPLDDATYQNAVKVIAQIMMDHGFNSPEELQPHHVVKGKDCPHHTLFNRRQFRRDVLEQKNKMTYKPFSDVPDDAWYATDVRTVSEADIMNGYPDGAFKPDQPVTRAELATVAARLINMLK